MTNATPPITDLDDRHLLGAGAVVTADARHTQREHAHLLHARGAHYLFTIKGNQPQLHRWVKALPWTDVPDGARVCCAGHGRRETRTIRVLTLPPEHAHEHGDGQPTEPFPPAR